MKKHVQDSFRRMVAMALCLAMLLPMIAVPGMATEAANPPETSEPVIPTESTEIPTEESTDPTEESTDPTEESTDPT